MVDPRHSPDEQDSLVKVFEALADQLATNSYAVAPHFLSEREAEDILSDLRVHEEKGGMKKAGIGTSDELPVDKQIRGDKIRWNSGDTILNFSQRQLSMMSPDFP